MTVDRERLETYFERDFASAQDNWKGLCPVHDERTPSFFVHKDEGLANCFGCGASGYVEVMLAKYKGISVEKARELLDINPGDRITQKIFNSKQEEVAVPKYFPESWLAPYQKGAYTYIINRFEDTGVDTLEAVALLKSVGSRYDTVGRRQVFPHRDIEGRLVGAVGRVIDDRLPRWHVYWDYARGENIYRPWGHSRDTLFLTEGILDLLKAKTLGLDKEYDLGSTQGTKFGRGQLKQMKQYDTVIIGFDDDKAGHEGGYKLYRKLNKSCKCLFINYPTYAKDLMDITSKEAALETANTHHSYVSWNTF